MRYIYFRSDYLVIDIPMYVFLTVDAMWKVVGGSGDTAELGASEIVEETGIVDGSDTLGRRQSIGQIDEMRLL